MRVEEKKASIRKSLGGRRGENDSRDGLGLESARWGDVEYRDVKGPM